MTPLVKPTGFREYDARWVFEKEINLLGIQALGQGLGTLIREMGKDPRIVVGHDFRGYSASIKQALTVGLMTAGIEVNDIGLALSPVAYFAQFDLDIPCVAMVTASHNENGWTGVKMGAARPLTFGPDEMGRLKEIVLKGEFKEFSGGAYKYVEGLRERYIADVIEGVSFSRKMKVIAACGNGTAGAYAPEALERMGLEVVPMDAELDHTFPRYNPNPEDMQMLHAMQEAVREHGADVALGFDGDGDRCGVVDDEGEEIFADKIGVLIARDLSAQHANAQFVVDVKSTGLFVTDPVLQKNGAKTEYWKTGHSYIKRKSHEMGALAGFEKSGHFFFNKPIGRGYDDGLVAAIALLQMLDNNPDKKLSDLRRSLPKTYQSPTMSPPLRRRNKIWRCRQGRGCALRAQRDHRPESPRCCYRQRRQDHRRRRDVGPYSRLLQQTGTRRRRRKPDIGGEHEGDVRPTRRGTRQASGSRRIQPEDLGASPPE